MGEVRSRVGVREIQMSYLHEVGTFSCMHGVNFTRCLSIPKCILRMSYISTSAIHFRGRFSPNVYTQEIFYHLTTSFRGGDKYSVYVKYS